MSTALALAVSAVVVMAVALGGYLVASHHRARLLETAKGAARDQAVLMGQALEHQMLENRRDLIREMVEGFGREATVARVMVLDREGGLQFFSSPPPNGALAPSSPTCRACHDRSAELRAQSVVLDTESGSVLRSVLPIVNGPRCHGCHDPARRINGLLVVDVPTSPMQAAFASDVRWIALGSGGLALVLLVAIGGVVRVVVLRRLRRFEQAARGIAAGDLTRRVPEGGNDTVGWLAREFNALAASASSHLDEVKRQQRHLETMLNSIDDGVVVIDREHRVVAANDAFLGRVGVTRDGIVGQSCRSVVDRLCNPETCPARLSFRSLRRHAALVVHAGPDGEQRYEEVRSSPIHGTDGEAQLAVEVWRDITERRLSEARMADSHRLASLGMLASAFSHEINTPLGSVLACVEGIVRTSEDASASPTELRAHVLEYGRLARSELLRCRGITQQFLRMSRGQRAATDVVDVAPMIEAVVRLVRPTAQEAGVAVLVREGPPEASVRVAEGELQQILLNLLLNAVQACARGGTVHVGLALDEQGAVHVRVQDDGRGIAQAHLGRIFEPFFSLRSGGTGLGLFISQNVARGFGGDILVSSAEGQGSTFEVVLPPAAGGPRRSGAEPSDAVVGG
jgi:PAS domain S-box-containing protein